MVAPAIYWGVQLLFWGGASIVALQRYQDQDLELGRIDLDDLMGGDRDPDPDPERRDPLADLIRLEGVRQIVEAQTRAKERLDEEDCEDCLECTPAKDGSQVTQTFTAGRVARPLSNGRGALYQHFVVPWFPMQSWDDGGTLRVRIDEWDWVRGPRASWDGLDFLQCTLLECKLGYRDHMDPDNIHTPRSYGLRNPNKRWLPPLLAAFGPQMRIQAQVVDAAGPPARLRWVLSDNDVLWQAVEMASDAGLYSVDFDHKAFPFAPTGTLFVNGVAEADPDKLAEWGDTYGE